MEGYGELNVSTTSSGGTERLHPAFSWCFWWYERPWMVNLRRGLCKRDAFSFVNAALASFKWVGLFGCLL
ncbi:hypothetical protein CCR75_007554 [Bremia lactucae]|uniref:Uncharacterized protein n=1 Tax=Bremia lactucae TaxID=4779 RepID=A0A976ILI4_BRELC|nr:hypothetical protein CCR75_007554 [Bremia lactucae]